MCAPVVTCSGAVLFGARLLSRANVLSPQVHHISYKTCPCRRHEGEWEWRYRFTCSYRRHKMEGMALRLGRSSPTKEPPYPLVGAYSRPGDLEQQNGSYFRRNSNSNRTDITRHLLSSCVYRYDQTLCNCCQSVSTVCGKTLTVRYSRRNRSELAEMSGFEFE